MLQEQSLGGQRQPLGRLRLGYALALAAAGQRPRQILISSGPPARHALRRKEKDEEETENIRKSL